MPREREEFFRESNIKEKEKIFVLAFEGNKTEHAYFSAFINSIYFNRELVFLHLLDRPSNDTNSSPKHVFNRLHKFAKEDFNLKKGDELWMIIDKDRWHNIPSIIQECKKLENMFVAVSNPCFEFWLLLHLADLNEFDANAMHLMQRNRKIGNRTYIETEILNRVGSYNKSRLRTSDFLPNLNLAVQRAKNLDSSEEEFPQSLGSHIYKLIMKLGNTHLS